MTKLLAILLVTTSCAIAQAANVTPGQVQQTVQAPRAMPIDQGVQLPELIGSSPRTNTVPPGGTPINVVGFDFTGNTMVPTATLQARVAGLVGKSITLAELYAAAQDLTRFYQSQGYPLASVNVPVQRVAGGKVLLEVTEGRIGKVRIERKGGWYKTEVFERQLKELGNGQVVTTAQLEREILLLNDLPGIEARVVIVPGAEAGTSDLVFQITEEEFAFYFGVDNHGRDDIGETRATLNTTINGLGRGDSLALSLTHSEQDLLNYGRLAYSMPIGTDGGRLGLSYSLTDYQNGDPVFALLDPAGRSYTWRGEYSFPLLRSRAANKVLTIGYASTHTQTEALGVITSQSRINLFDITLYGNEVYGDRHTFSYSIGLTGNGEYNTGSQDGQQCCMLSGDIGMTFPVGDSWYQKLSLRAAWAPDTVADIQRFSIGGPYSVRGYEASEQRGDSGFDSSWELHRPFGLFGGRAEAVLFVDAGEVLTNTGGQTVAGPLLGSVGAGFTAFDVYGFECNLMWATAVGGYQPSDGENKGRGYFSIGTRF